LKEDVMPEYLAPGVYVEETSFRSKSIEGVSTTTTGFIGPTRYGPVDLEPDIITSVGEFERVYGDGKQLEFTTDTGVTERMDNYVWHAVRAFFEEGGKRLYVVRTFRPATDKDGTVTDDGHSVAWLPSIDKPSATERPKSIRVKARFPGKAGKIRVKFTVRLGLNVFGSLSDATTQVRPTVGGLQTNDIVWISLKGDTASGKLYRASKYYDDDLKKDNWEFSDLVSSPAILHLERESIPDLVVDAHRVQVVTLTVTVFPEDPDAAPLVYTDLPLDPQHGRQGARDSVADKFARRPNNLEQARSLPIIIEFGTGVKTGLDLFNALNATPGSGLLNGLKQEQSTDDARSLDLLLKGGNDGLRPAAAQYDGEAKPDSTAKTGLKAFEDIEDVSIIAAPGSTYGLENGYQDDAKTIVNLLISHATRMRYRIAVLDSGDGQSISQVRKFRAKIDSTYAALYYPWVRVLDPITGKENHLPPSGFVAGIYARNDINRAVYKAPANEVVNGAIGFEHLLNKAQQDVLNPEGINCFRFFEGRGFRLWGARTISSDPEWKYVNVRRYFIYLERSIDRGTQWAVFEPNGEALWANIRRTVEDFLLNEWQMGALLGDKPEKAYFVKCDRSTMTQNDLDNGRLVCLIGVAPLRPAEFVIFRIGQWTADRRL
jgi:phage tail sheath protein FI